MVCLLSPPNSGSFAVVFLFVLFCFILNYLFSQYHQKLANEQILCAFSSLLLLKLLSKLSITGRSYSFHILFTCEVHDITMFQVSGTILPTPLSSRSLPLANLQCRVPAVLFSPFSSHSLCQHDLTATICT